jgi:hypothetical protein
LIFIYLVLNRWNAFEVSLKGNLHCMLYYADSLYTGSNVGAQRISCTQGPINVYILLSFNFGILQNI